MAYATAVPWREASSFISALESDAVVQFLNCRLLRIHNPEFAAKLELEDLYVRNGRVIDPATLFYHEKKQVDLRVNCEGRIVTAGFIDIQINGAIGIDFSAPTDAQTTIANMRKVGKKLFEHGVTGFCPTIVTSSPQTYHKIIPQLVMLPGSAEGAATLGVHVEGPFITVKGAHNELFLQKSLEGGMDTLTRVLGEDLTNMKITTIAPEIPGALEVISSLSQSGVVVSSGHSNAHVATAEQAWNHGARLITHLFNAMLPFHHRDPGLIGLLAPAKRKAYYSIIVDGIHTHSAAVKIAYCTNPHGCVLITDAMSAMCLESGHYMLGEMHVDIDQSTKRATLANSDTLAGSIATMDECVRKLKEFCECSIEEALACANYHPAQVLGRTSEMGTLCFGSQADFILLDDDLQVLGTFVAGHNVWMRR